jgi:hypothetical protein
MNELTIEIAPFRLAPGVTEAALIAASAALQRDFLAGRPGFLRRELLRTGEGFADLVLWENAAAAEAAMAEVGRSAACAAYFRLMAAEDADPTAGVRHHPVLASYD